MIHLRLKKIGLALACVLMVASCGSIRDRFSGGSSSADDTGEEAAPVNRVGGPPRKRQVGTGSSLLDAFKDSEANVKVNRFLWTASLDVLSFLPIQTADPFTGVISTGYGRPPGGGQAYRATVLISDPALDARSLKVALQTQRGPVSNATQRAVEDAILARARQLRINAGRF
ncbi:DUF3576 domain-containing protein [uncultured Roseovarius sp.]|uniref:DUF3576 domain-containing protein n=1 Tax=uncultured Roseovarius sp. TaxID=293344 RepID=UPI00261A5BE9|nr:DUF3576 domain-containing protein [uncultured Roseovarius sp.]